MTAGRGDRQHTQPLYIGELSEGATVRALKPLDLARTDQQAIHHDEGWLQRLIYRFPQVLPVQEIEPGFGRLIAVCLELPTPAGSVDNLFVTDRGDLVIAECKLWRNPQARREVVAQIVDYAHSLSSWSYADLESAVSKASTADGATRPASLFEAVGDDGDLSEPDFIDAVSRNLRLGRALLLIVGDGIREGVESLAGYLQRHAGFHFTLGIVELPVYELPQGGYIVQPRVLARTVNIERGIVKIVDGQAVVAPSEQSAADETSGRRTSISQERMLELLAEVDPELPRTLETFLDRAKDHGVYMEAATKSLQLRWRGPDDIAFALGGINDKGVLLTDSINWPPDQIGRIDLAHEYLKRIAKLVNGSVRQTPHPAAWYVVTSGTQRPPAQTLLARQDEWLAEIHAYTEKLREAVAKS